MVQVQPDTRSEERKRFDEQLAAEAGNAPLDAPKDAKLVPMESLLKRSVRRPFAIAGIVENGVVRPIDSGVKLLEKSRVIIVATEPNT